MHILIAATPKSPTGIGQFANRYWPIRQPVLANSPTGIGQINNRYWRNHQPLNQGTSWQFDQYRLAIWPIPVGVLVNTGWWIGQYRLANWSIPVGELANTGWRFQNVGDGTFWTSLPLPYEDIYFQSCLANYLSVEGSISFWKKAYLDVHMYLNGQKGS